MSGVLTGVKVAGVFLLLAATLIYIRRHDRGRLRVARKSQRPVTVLGQARLSKASSVAIVDIAGAAYAVAVTDQRVSLLLPDAVTLPEAAPAAQPAPATVTVGRESPGPSAPAATRRTGGRPSFGEALAQQVRILTRRETPIALHDLSPATAASRPVAPTVDGSAVVPAARMPGTHPG